MTAVVEKIESLGNRSTKAEMFAVLNAAKKHIKHLESNKIHEKSQSINTDDLQTDVDYRVLISTAKQAGMDTLSEMENDYTKLSNKLDQVKEAVTDKEQRLTELYKIEKEMLDLASIIEAKKLAKESKEAEIEEFEKKYKLLTNDLHTNHSRELKELSAKYDAKQTELEYQQAKKIRDWEDSFDKNKREQERNLSLYIAKSKEELQAREKAIQEKEDYGFQLEKQVAEFDERLETAVQEATSSLEDKLNRSHNYTVSSLKKDLENQRKLADLEINSLNTAITNLREENSKLTEKLDQARSSVQEIATTAVQSAKPQIHHLNNTVEK